VAISFCRFAVLSIPILIGVALPAPGQPPVVDLREQEATEAALRKRLAPLIPTFRAALLGDDTDAQRATLAIIADIPPTLAATGNLSGALVTFLQKDIKDPETLALAIRAFGRTYPDAADLDKVIGRYLRSDFTIVRRASAEALTSALSNAAPLRDVERFPYFAQIAKQAIPMLGVGIEDKDGVTQRIALGGVQITARGVNRLYTSDEPLIIFMRQWFQANLPAGLLKPAIEALGEVTPKLTSAFASSDPMTRIAAARTLAAFAALRKTVVATPEIGAKPAADPFVTRWPAAYATIEKGLKDPNPEVRLAIVDALESLGDTPEARALLRQAASDRNVFVRWATARALGLSAPAKPDPKEYAPDVAALAILAGDSDIDVRTAAVNSLTRFGRVAKPAAPALLGAVATGDVEPRVAAVQALSAVDSEAASSVPVLVGALQHSDLRLRRAAANALIRFGPDARPALAELRKALTSTDTELRLAAAEAILAIERKPRPKEL
jgi:hypothetical protein